MSWGAFRQGLELTLHLEVEQDPKELQEDLSGDRRAKGPEAGRNGKGGPLPVLHSALKKASTYSFNKCLLSVSLAADCL